MGDTNATAQMPSNASPPAQVCACPITGVTEFASLVRSIRNGQHAINFRDFECRLELGVLWEWSDLEFRIAEGLLTAAQVDDAIHQGLAVAEPRKGAVTVPGPI